MSGGLGTRYQTLLVCLAAFTMSGCAAITNPVANGIPVRLLPSELLAESREGLEQTPLDWMRQKPPKIYLLGPGDILGVYIEGVLGTRDQLPPVNIPEGDLPPALGFPIPLREDGTVPLPLIDPVNLVGLSLAEAEQQIIKEYTITKQLLQPGRERIIVTLIRKRTIRVLVIRQDSQQGVGLNVGSMFGGGLGGGVELTSSGSGGEGQVLNLPAYENDVLSALTRTGGLPAFNTLAELLIQRGGLRADESERFSTANENTTRIPLKIRPGEPAPFSEKDILLNEGDIVFVKRRDPEFFFTGGLMVTAEIPLPVLDQDLRVVEAVIRARGPLLNGGINSSNLNGAIVGSGLGNPSPSNLTVIRRLKDGRVIPIKVDLNRALTDSRENILVQHNDLLILQETPGEAMGRYVSGIWRFNFFFQLFERQDGIGTSSLGLP
jgi:hypothetical protein